jgi:hypothetical protein
MRDGDQVESSIFVPQLLALVSMGIAVIHQVAPP